MYSRVKILFMLRGLLSTESHSSTLPAAVRLVISMLKRYSPGKGEREKEREERGREREREREREGGGTGEREEERGREHKSSMPMNDTCHD